MESGPDTPVNAATIDLLANMSTRDAFKMIGLACLKQVVNNVPALVKGDPEGVHQMRVGLRRLRAGMSLFADLLRDPQTAGIKAGLQVADRRARPCARIRGAGKPGRRPAKKTAFWR